MKEIISLYFGGTGINLCSPLLDHYQFDENITDEGSCGLNIAQTKFYNPDLFEKIDDYGGYEEHGDDQDSLEHNYAYDKADLNRSRAERDQPMSHFYESSDGKVKSLSILVDSDPYDIEKVMVGKKRKLFHPDQFLFGKENSSGNFGKSQYHMGQEKEKFDNSIRRLVERCDNFAGFAYHLSGVSGSGGAACSSLDWLLVDHDKKVHLFYPVFQDLNHNSNSMEIYNSTFVMRSMIEKSSLAVVYNNDSMKRYLYSHGIECITNQLLNSLMAHSLSLFTAGYRRGGNRNMTQASSSTGSSSVWFPNRKSTSSLPRLHSSISRRLRLECLRRWKKWKKKAWM